jgi:PAS domain S-box-containing protein
MMGAAVTDPLSSSRSPLPPAVIGSRLTVILLVLLAALGGAAVLNAKALAAFVEGSRRVSHTHQVLEMLEGVYGDINQAIASVRLYVITGKDRELEPRRLALQSATMRLDRLERMLSDNPAQLERSRLLRELIARRGDYLHEVIRLRGSGGLIAAQQLIENNAVREYSGRMDRTLESMELEERRLLDLHRRHDEQQLRFLYSAAALLLVLIIVLAVFSTVRLRRELLERGQLSSQLAESRLFLESVIEHLPMFVFVKRASDLRFVRLNSAGEKMIGMRREELLGLNNEDKFDAAVAQYHTRQDLAALASGEVHDSPDEVIQLGVNAGRHLHVRRVVIKDADGKAAYVLGIAEDVTDRKAAEEHIRQLNEDLARKNLSLEVSNRELESFTYTVSHDLRAPLRAIASFSEMLREDFGSTLDPEALRYLKVISDGSARMNRLIDDLLAFSRVGRVGLRRSRVDMQQLVKESVDDALPPGAARPDIQIDPLPAIEADIALLRNVWVNLISNAVKYSSGRADARVHIGGHIEGRDAVYFVQDNGAGFDMRYYHKLFGVFQRLHSDAEFAGTGVGLAIVQRIVVRHGGRVWARSAPGEGARFSFSLPTEGPE